MVFGKFSGLRINSLKFKNQADIDSSSWDFDLDELKSFGLDIPNGDLQFQSKIKPLRIRLVSRVK